MNIDRSLTKVKNNRFKNTKDSGHTNGWSITLSISNEYRFGFFLILGNFTHFLAKMAVSGVDI